jgi:hypothetical protein
MERMDVKRTIICDTPRYPAQRILRQQKAKITLLFHLRELNHLINFLLEPSSLSCEGAWGWISNNAIWMMM